MHGRFLLPSLFGFLLPLATVVVPAHGFRWWRAAALASIAGWTVVCALWLRVPYVGHGTPGPWGIADERGFYTYHMQMPNPIYIGDYLRHPYVAQFGKSLLSYDRAVVLQAGPGLAFVTSLAPSVPRPIRVVLGLSNVGVLGYLAGPDVHVIDRQGLSDPIAARILLTRRGRPGHEKFLPEAWIVARFGDREAAITRSPAATDAVRALGCGDLARLLRAVDGPITPSRFLSNVGAAWTLHRLRIPADPAAARDRFCAPGTTATPSPSSREGAG